MNTPNPPPPSPSDPSSSLSHTLRIACWITGGPGKRVPATATSILKMARERRDIDLAREAWEKRKQASLDAHEAKWEEIPKGVKLLRWWREKEDGNAPAGGAVGAGRMTAGRTCAETERAEEPERGARAPDEEAQSEESAAGAQTFAGEAPPVEGGLPPGGPPAE